MFGDILGVIIIFLMLASFACTIVDLFVNPYKLLGEGEKKNEK